MMKKLLSVAILAISFLLVACTREPGRNSQEEFGATSNDHIVSELSRHCSDEDADAFLGVLEKNILNGWKPDMKLEICEMPLISGALWSSIGTDYLGLDPKATNDREVDALKGTAVIALLIKQGHSPNSIFGPSELLYTAVMADRPDLVSLLLVSGANPNCRSEVTGAPVLSRSRSLSITSMLLDSGADPKQTDAKGRSCLDLLVAHPRMANYIRFYIQLDKK